MCTNPKRVILKGQYKTDNWHGKKGQNYEIDAITKCGYCPQCVAEKANNWVIRNYYESKTYKKMCFITLTYENNPYFLVKKDVQDFIKRLRRYLEYRKLDKIRTFYCGEYGSISNRPHYHVIIYGWEDPTAEYKRLSKKGYPVYESKIITKLWSLGLTAYSKFTDFEIPYITLYDTPKNKTSFTYRITRKTAKKHIKILEKRLQESNNYYLSQSILNRIDTLIEKIKEEKTKYITIKEFNGWSQGLGFENFFKEYQKNKTYDWNEFIYDNEFVTPTPWVKKLANWGFEDAREEMLRRSSELTSKSEDELQHEAEAREKKTHAEEIIQWQTDKDTRTF